MPKSWISLRGRGNSQLLILVPVQMPNSNDRQLQCPRSYKVATQSILAEIVNLDHRPSCNCPSLTGWLHELAVQQMLGEKLVSQCCDDKRQADGNVLLDTTVVVYAVPVKTL